jgi:hypothetical protein
MKQSLVRQRYLIDYAFAALARHKSLHLGLLLIYTLIVFSLASVLMFGHAVRNEAAILFTHSPDLVLQRVIAGRHELISSDYLASAKVLPGVERAQGRLWGYYYDPVVKANYTVMVPPQDAPENGSAVIGEGVARTRGASPGDVLSFRGQNGELFPFSVASVLPATSNIVSADLMLLSESDFRRFFAIEPGLFTDITLRLSSQTKRQAVAKRLTSQLSNLRAISRDDVLRYYRHVFDWREGMVMVLLLGAIMALMIFAIQKATGLSAEERLEIWLLKAVGWDTADVIASKIWEGVLISVTAFLVGSTLAYWHVFSASYLFLEPVLIGWSTLKPALHLVPFIDGWQLLMLCLFTIVPYALATTGPIWRVAVADSDTLGR